MSNAPTAHYPTFAVFLLDDRLPCPQGLIAKCAIGNDDPEKGMVRKLCACGSEICYETNPGVWMCNNSGTKLDILARNLEPILPARDVPSIEFPKDIGHPEREAIALLDDEGIVHVFAKIPRDKTWVLGDPLPVNSYFVTEPLETDLFVKWMVDIGAGFPRSVWLDLSFNVCDHLQSKCLMHLTSDEMVYLHLLEADTLSRLGVKRIQVRLEAAYTVKKAFELAARLPTAPADRTTALVEFAEAQELAATAFADKAGVLLCIEFERLIKAGHVEALSEHMKGCRECQRVRTKGWTEFPEAEES